MLQELKAFLLRALDFMLRKRNFLFLKFEQKNLDKSYSTLSDSQKTYYEKAVSRMIVSNFKLKRFRRIYNYREIVETVTYKQGIECLNRIELLGSLPTYDFSKHFVNDSFGKPIKFYYPSIGNISPTTIRYISIAFELKKLFGEELKGNFVEIGVGYGGQASILNDFFKIDEYGIFDLSDVQQLTKIYLTQIGKADNLKMYSLTDNPLKEWDLVISNYAFSELPLELQKIYIEKVISRSKRGYLIMNSGMNNSSGRSDGKLHLAELRTLLPVFEILDEIPNTGPDNYVIVWGHNRVLI
jgi:putative sugar O-methyltransferase